MTPHRPLSALAALLLLLVPGCGEPPPGDRSFEALARESLPELDGEVTVPGLQGEVEVIRDEWGIPHIYAERMEDLFFAQGYIQAQDRLWQMDMWRRIAQGTTAEIAGPDWLPHDRLQRILGFRGPFDDEEFARYHPEGRRILTAFSEGVNAYIEHAGDELPVEYRLTGLRPEPWTPETSLVRVRVGPQASAARRKLRLAMSVAELGVEEANRRDDPVPWNELRVPEGLDVSLITEEVLAPLSGNRYGDWPQPELLPEFRDLPGATASVNRGAEETSPGSNNWAVRGHLTATGEVLHAADPHRQVSNPALRYLVHLNAPGWNVTGMTEPGLPGVYVGHNGQVAWGRTATGNDMHDVFVEEVNPEDRNEVLYRGEWVPLEIVEDTIHVAGAGPEILQVKYSRHGPIFYEDTVNHRAYALRSPVHRRGSAEYLGALHLNQGESAELCLTERTPRMPQTNLVCGDVHGNIAYQNAALHPERTPGWYGRLPAPGTGAYEWLGWRTDLPTTFNPDTGWVATANESIQPPGGLDPPLYFQPRFERRKERVRELLLAGSGFTVEDFKAIQLDILNTEAVELQPHFRGWSAEDEGVEEARAMVAEWDGRMHRESTAAAVYMAWRGSVDLGEVQAAEGDRRRALVEAGLDGAVDSLTASLGEDRSRWRWGRMHTMELPHPLVSAYDLPPFERGGGAGTVNATGAVYRHIVDFSELDNSVVTMAPGQSGRPESPYYGSLLEPYVEDEYIPLLHSREAVEEGAVHRLLLRPGG